MALECPEARLLRMSSGIKLKNFMPAYEGFFSNWHKLPDDEQGGHSCEHIVSLKSRLKVTSPSLPITFQFILSDLTISPEFLS